MSKNFHWLVTKKLLIAGWSTCFPNRSQSLQPTDRGRDLAVLAHARLDPPIIIPKHIWQRLPRVSSLCTVHGQHAHLHLHVRDIARSSVHLSSGRNEIFLQPLPTSQSKPDKNARNHARQLPTQAAFCSTHMEMPCGIWIHSFVYMYVYVYIYTCISIYTYICIYLYIYNFCHIIHIYIYTYCVFMHTYVICVCHCCGGFRFLAWFGQTLSLCSHGILVLQNVSSLIATDCRIKL